MAQVLHNAGVDRTFAYRNGRLVHQVYQPEQDDPEYHGHLSKGQRAALTSLAGKPLQRTVISAAQAMLPQPASSPHDAPSPWLAAPPEALDSPEGSEGGSPPPPARPASQASKFGGTITSNSTDARLAGDARPQPKPPPLRTPRRLAVEVEANEQTSAAALLEESDDDVREVTAVVNAGSGTTEVLQRMAATAAEEAAPEEDAAACAEHTLQILPGVARARQAAEAEQAAQGADGDLQI